MATVIPANGQPHANIIKIGGEHVIPDFDTLDRMTSRKQKVNAKLENTKQAVVAEALDLLEPVGIWSIIEPDHFSAFPGTSRRSFSGIQSMLGVVCTIGGRLEKQTHQYFEKQDYLPGYYLDMVGTLAVSRLAQIIAEDLRGQYGARYWAPGDDRGDTELESQRFLFDLIPVEKIGIQLSASNVMLPIKSLSFILVIGEQISGLFCSKACSQCAWNGMCDRRFELAK